MQFLNAFILTHVFFIKKIHINNIFDYTRYLGDTYRLAQVSPLDIITYTEKTYNILSKLYNKFAHFLKLKTNFLNLFIIFIKYLNLCMYAKEFSKNCCIRKVDTIICIRSFNHRTLDTCIDATT